LQVDEINTSSLGGKVRVLLLMLWNSVSLNWRLERDDGYLLVVVIEWWQACQKLVKDDTDQVPVDSFPMTFLQDHLRSKIRI